MTTITIHINLAGRSYPATVNAEQELYVRKASKQINEQVKKYAAQFPSTDVQDQLALAALDNLSRQIQQEDEWSISQEQTNSLIHEIDGLLDIK